MNLNSIKKYIEAEPYLDAILGCLSYKSIGASISLYIPKDCLEERLGFEINQLEKSPEFKKALYIFSKENGYRTIINVNSGLYLLKSSNSEAINEVIKSNLNNDSGIIVYQAEKGELKIKLKIGKVDDANCKSCYFLNKSENICLLYDKLRPEKPCGHYTFYSPIINGPDLSRIIKEIYSLVKE